MHTLPDFLLSVSYLPVVDTTITFAGSDSVTFVHMGFARPGSTPARQVRLFTDKAGDPGAGNVAVRVIHAGAGLGDLDAFLIRHLQELRADKLAITADLEAASSCSRSIVMPKEIDEFLAPIPYIIPAQLFAALLAEAKGLDPDTPRSLSKVTRTL